MMNSHPLVVVLMVISVSSVNCDRWFMYRLLRNPGLNSTTAINAYDCIDQCRANTACSAISYQFSSGLCVQSYCNNLDLYKSTGWNTYVIGSLLMEQAELPAPQFEWMLTDTCGSTNQGVTNGPTITLTSVTYSASQSVTAGNAATFTNSSVSRGESASDTRLNNPMGTTSLTVMMWAYWNSENTRTTLFEFYNGTSRGLLFWLANGGLWFDMSNYLGMSCPATNCGYNTYSMTAAANTWYHIAFSYDASTGIVKTYLNSTLKAETAVGKVTNLFTWNLAYIGYSSVDSSGYMDGRLYCFKVFDIALSTNQVAALAESCYFGKTRYSN